MAKANRSLGFVKRNLYPCTEITKRSAYVTIVRPTLEYATAVWDPKVIRLRSIRAKTQSPAISYILFSC